MDSILVDVCVVADDFDDYNACIAGKADIATMANLTIRNLDDDLKARLRVRAARNGCSMEQEAREILRRAVLQANSDANFANRIRARFADLKVDELPIPKRRAARVPRSSV